MASNSEVPATGITGLIAALKKGVSADVGGLVGSASSYLASVAFKELAKDVILIAPSVDAADNAARDLATFLGNDTVKVLPARETMENSSALSALNMERLGVLANAHKHGTPMLIVASINAVLQELPQPDLIESSMFSLMVKTEASISAIAETLMEKGYARAAMVESPGEFALRGGIMDIYPHALSFPVRIEFRGDIVESIRFFEPATQVSVEKRDSVSFPLMSSGELFQTETMTSSIMAHMKDCAAFVLEPAETFRRAHAYLDIVSATPMLSRMKLEQFIGELNSRQCLTFAALLSEFKPGSFRFRTSSTKRFSGDLHAIFAELKDISSKMRETFVVCSTEGERTRFTEMLAESAPELVKKLGLRVGYINAGFEFPDLGIAYLPHSEIFNRYRQLRPSKERHSTQSDEFMEFVKGDYVVHQRYGIGKYMGMKTERKDGKTQDFLVIEFQNQSQLFAPAAEAHLVEKFMGTGEHHPELSVLGTGAWEGRKIKVQQAVNDLAKELLEVQVIRQQEMGIVYGPDTEWQKEFEASFPYEDTDDQSKITIDIKADMEMRKPMDRLICGDVGYGKTELAMRAAFKAVMGGKQVAVLVPTTVLAQQHYKNFKERMADYPVRVEVLSRFRKRAEQKEVIKWVAEGEVDIIIGTHRLLQKDISFKDLGLIVIDEEQRFGVGHKERLKKMRAVVDILTMTATPIPRTLHMALMGIKDISSLITPPPDRMAIHTEVMHYDEKRIREAIVNEISRDGQVFFVHNRVHNIDKVANKIKHLVPEARVNIVHGQMEPTLLEKRMMEFIDGTCNVLVTTTIIESGVDIPNANTLFVNEADHYGLADLHQLRGRVGRYRNKAYSYFLIPNDRPIAPEAEKRLKAIEQYTELGAGFKIALRDLEIRGAGNIIGKEQSGHIASVGYDMYCRLLKHAVSRIKNEKLDQQIECSVNLAMDVVMSPSYIGEDFQRLHFYKMLSRARNTGEVASARKLLEDMFGPPPAEVELLFTLAQIRIDAAKLTIYEVNHGPQAVEMKYVSIAPLEQLNKAMNGGLRFVDDRTAALPVTPDLKDTHELVAYLAEALAVAAARL